MCWWKKEYHLFSYVHVAVFLTVQVLACYLLRDPLYTLVYPRLVDCAASVSTQVISKIKTSSLDSWYNKRSAAWTVLKTASWSTSFTSVVYRETQGAHSIISLKRVLYEILIHHKSLHHAKKNIGLCMYFGVSLEGVLEKQDTNKIMKQIPGRVQYWTKNNSRSVVWACLKTYLRVRPVRRLLLNAS